MNKFAILFSLLTTAVYVFAIILFSYQQGGTLYAKLVAVLMMITFLFFVVVKWKRVYFPVPYRYLAVWILFCVISALLAQEVNVALARLITVCTIVGAALIITNFLIVARDTTAYQLFILLATFASTALVARNLWAYSTPDGRVFGTLGNSNLYALLLVINLTIGVAFAIFKKNWLLKLIGLLAIGVSVVMILHTGSKKGMAGIILVPAIFYFLWSGMNMRRRPVLVMLAGALAFLVLVGAVSLIMTGQHFDRLEVFLKGLTSGELGRGDNSTAGRIELYRIGYQVAMDNLILGVGLDNFKFHSGGSFGFDAVGVYAHSNYIELLATCGILAFTAYYGAFIYMLYTLFKLRRCIYFEETAARYSSTTVVVFLILIFDFAFVSYAAKFTWILMPWLIADVHLLKAWYRWKERSNV